MLNRLTLGLFALAIGWTLYQPAQADDAPAHAQAFEREMKIFIEGYCIDCHTGEQAEADLRLEQVEYAAIEQQRAHWESVLKMLETTAMPPEDAAQPTPAERASAIKVLEEALFHFDCDQPHDPGRVTIRRLNRQEYNRTIRDLLGVDLEPARDFPSDDVGHGFDNIGDVLSLPPLLFEKYMDAAEQVAAAAIQVPDPATFTRERRERDQLQPAGATNLNDYGVYAFHSEGTVTAKFSLPRSGAYVLSVEAGADQAGDEVAKLELKLADKTHVFEIEAPASEPQGYAWHLIAEAGEAEVVARFANDFYQPDAADPEKRDRNLYIRSIELTGPVDIPADQLTDAHRRLITTTPEDSSNRRQLRRASRQILEPFLVRAYRRPVTSEEVRPLIGLVQLAVENGESFERGVQLAVTAALVSPHFLFRIEQDTEPNNPELKRSLNDFELATRLSYFLWSSMPDEELFNLARESRLHEPEVLTGQVDRMLKDEKARALADNFGAQWLNLRNLADVAPNPELFPQFDAALRDAMQRETMEFFAHIVREDRPLTDFLTADYTFVNQRLAAFYGLPPVEGEAFQRVALTDRRRAGVLTHASILTLTSNPGRTSPVKRGKWIMENILGTPPPDPPPNVPQLEATQEAAPNLPLRKQLELHRSDPVCASCHRQMDALGFAFENYDAIGQWRDQDGANPIDPSGVLPDGTEFTGPAALMEVLGAQKAQFTKAMAEKMLTYALGRGLEFYDQCAVDKIVEQVTREEYRFSALVKAVVLSDPFLMRRGEKPADPPEMADKQMPEMPEAADAKPADEEAAPGAEGPATDGPATDGTVKE